jgi:DNA repair photolyase
MGEFRWRLAEDDGGQPALFNGDDLVDRHVGKGEFRGMEFLHVNARTIINEVPNASRMPFRFTINAYRGCSHACSYCLLGTTPVLMGDGRSRPIAELRRGDEILGTKDTPHGRELIPTTVLDHWSTRRRAYVLSLDDGRSITASADHRFLADDGWKCVAALQPGDSLNGGDVRSVEALGVELPMYDITTGTGDFIANGVVSHNCFARPTHEYLNLNMADDFEKRIVVKVNAVERVRAELRSPKWSGDHIAMGTNTDPYQRCEGKYHLTRGIIQALSEARNPFSILTKSTLILRDLDVLTEAAKRTEVRANFSIGTLDEDVWRRTEPGTPHPRRRVEAVAKLNAAGIETGVLVAPVLPGMSDSPEQLDEVVGACVEAGAVSITSIYLHLRRGVKEHFLNDLATDQPDVAAELAKRYRGAYLPKADNRRLASQVSELIEDHGGLPARRRSSDYRPARPAPSLPPPPPEQLSFT